jgi:DNA-binding CsgD family transcriptional regulator
MTAAHCALGAIYLDIFARDDARRHLQRARTLAEETRSQHWIRCAAGYLASLYTQTGEIETARSVLDAVITPDTPARTLGQRLAWCSRAEIELAVGRPMEALAIVERLLASAANVTGDGSIPFVSLLHGIAVQEIGELDRSDLIFAAGYDTAVRQGARSVAWRLAAARGKLLLQQKRRDEAARLFAEGRALVAELAASLADATLRTGFERAALTHLQPAAPESPQRAEAARYGGLTPREREIAAFVARGCSNREIAEALVLGDRTIETHVSNILAKLGFTSRVQIAAWAVEHGLAGDRPEGPE